VGGPGVEFDFVRLAVEATAAAGAYLIWKEVASDVRSAVRRLRRLSGDHVVIDEGAAIVTAVDAVVEPGTFAVAEVQFVATLHLPEDEEYGPARGYLVGLGLADEVRLVCVDPDGNVIGSAGLEGIDVSRLGI
jgi:hypothetical protein